MDCLTFGAGDCSGGIQQTDIGQIFFCNSTVTQCLVLMTSSEVTDEQDA